MILSLPQSHMPTLMISLISLAIILIMPKIPLAKKTPSTTLGNGCRYLYPILLSIPWGCYYRHCFGGIPQGLPSLHFLKYLFLMYLL